MYSLWLDDCVVDCTHMSLLEHSMLNPFCINSLHSCFWHNIKVLSSGLHVHSMIQHAISVTNVHMLEYDMVSHKLKIVGIKSLPKLSLLHTL